ncbi:MAG: PEGA domain-containing protein [Deltaproteobacteria bacterium]|nr:PEGA domain-containing protein [Deltaproteobacteria bacterium]
MPLRPSRRTATSWWAAALALVLLQAAPATAADTLVEPEVDEAARVPVSLLEMLTSALHRGRPEQPWVAHEVPPVRSDLSRARNLARAGRAHYQNLAFEEALRQLRAARDAYDRSLLALDDLSELIEVQLDLAQALIDSGLGSAADAELRTLARLAPALELDPAKRPPQLLDAFSRARAQVSAQPSARLKVEATPSATVIVDCAPRGTTPVEITLPPGDHVLRVRRPGHRDHVERLRLSPSERVSRDLVLTATPSGAAREQLRRAFAEGRGEAKAAAELGRVVGADRVLVARVAERRDVCVIGVAVVEVKAAKRRSVVVAAAEGACSDFPTSALTDIGRALGTKGETWLLVARDRERRTALGLDAGLFTGVPPAPAKVAGGGVGGVVGPTGAAPPVRPPGRKSVWRAPWFWTIVAVVAAGTATSLYFGLSRTVHDPDRVQVNFRWPP